VIVTNNYLRMVVVPISHVLIDGRSNTSKRVLVRDEAQDAHQTVAAISMREQVNNTRHGIAHTHEDDIFHIRNLKVIVPHVAAKVFGLLLRVIFIILFARLTMRNIDVNYSVSMAYCPINILSNSVDQKGTVQLNPV